MEDGTVTIARAAMSLTPAERREVLQDNVNSTLELRRGAGITGITI